MNIKNCCCILLFLIACSREKAPQETDKVPIISTFLISNRVCNRASAYTDSNKIIEDAENVYITFLDIDYNIIVVKFDKVTQAVIDSCNLTNSVDNHGNPTIDIDDDGYIYVVYGGHSTEIVLAKTIQPYDITHWQFEMIRVGDKELTYPIFKVYDDKQYLLLRTESTSHTDGAVLCFMSRNVNSETWDVKDLFHGNHDQWFEDDRLNTSSGYNRFYANMLIHDHKIHISFQCSEHIPKDIDEFCKQNSYCIGYLCSDDKGEHWKTFLNREITSYPASPKDIDLVAGNSEPSDADPYYQISTLVLDRDYPIIMHVDDYNDYTSVVINKLHKSKNDECYVYESKFNQDYYVYGESSLSIDSNGYLYMLLTVFTPEEYKGLKRYGAPSVRLIWMVCDMNGKIVKSDFILPNTGLPVWLPNFGKQNRDLQYFVCTEGNNPDNQENKLWFGWVDWK